MIQFEKFDHIYLHREFVDGRKSINGLVQLVQEEMELNPFSKALFVFTSRKRDRLKLLYWDRTGFALWLKRLEKERFIWPVKSEDMVMSLTASQIEYLLDGVQFWYSPHKTLSYSAVS